MGGRTQHLQATPSPGPDHTAGLPSKMRVERRASVRHPLNEHTFWMAELADAIIRAVFQAAEVARIAGDRSPQGLTDDGERMVPEFHRGTYVNAEHMARYLLSAAFVR